MDEIDKARIIRELVLCVDDDVEWGSTVFETGEHKCWHVRGHGWRATISNLWDVMSASGRLCETDASHAFELRQSSILEVHEEHGGARIMGMSFGTDPTEDLLFAFEHTACDQLFRHVLIAGVIEKERQRSRAASTVIHGRSYGA